MPPLTPEEQKTFDIASEHPYDCACSACVLWWANVPPEDEDGDTSTDDEPAF